MSTILRASDISKKYQLNSHDVLHATQFNIKSGCIYVIEGKSGSGKSTLLSILGGMEHPTRGKVYYNNQSFYELSDTDQAYIRGNKYGFVFQSFQLIPELTVRENIELPLQFTKSTANIDVQTLAKELGLSAHLHKKPTFLSGGEQQRVAIARALITSPQIIFADEPTGNLDQKTTESVIKLLTRLCERNNIALVVVTHEQHLFKDYPHNLYTMADGILEVEYENI